ncbi:DUF5117 domain-containing protein [Mucilaginibacter celer]|uniref:DUF5117 domain-containing protein n=2 Tax=Mucilaginibacter celer TaxID=2305508 RepID=A0A494VZ97_9SPHI|nr:DUF5117 domain-containing protein [Mucilaginibacter celer]
MLAAALTLAFGTADAQKKSKNATAAVDTAKAKSLALLAAAKPATTLKPYKEVVPATAKTLKSFFSLHLVADRYLFEIPDSLLKKDILVVSRIDKAPTGFRLPGGYMSYAGDEAAQSVIEFEKVPGDKIVMRSVAFREFSNDTTENGLARTLINSNYQTIQGAFPIKALNKEGKSSVIDMTDFINSDNSIFAIGEPFVRNFLGFMATDRSFIDDAKAFPTNVEIRSVKTYNQKPGPNGTPPPFSFEFNSSIVLLPAVPMKARLADPRIGFFSNSYIDFDANPHGVASTSYIWRWRMEPKAEDMDKYKRGELVEPQKPIVIYVDPATPKKWIPYLKQGINDWQAAFEKAGFKNAIVAKDAPLNDSTWSIDDARHSVLVYKPSAIPNAMGPSIKDPRTGEILETHINWYHSVMTLVQNWYTVQAGAIDPRARKPQLDDELMGQLIRFVSSHEIGHTLGLMHNFGSSSTVPVANLRNKAWVEEHGHTPSIMDYARFNYVAQPEDNISEKGIFPRIGDYDKWAIEWGYKLIPDAKTTNDEKPILNKWMIDKLASGKQYFYGSQVDAYSNDIYKGGNLDPRDQSEDLGDDAMLASTYGIKNLKRVVPNLTAWLKEPNENYDKIADMYTEVVTEYGRFMGHVLKNIGGVYTTPKTTEQAGPVFEVVEKAKQKRAMAFLQEQLFTTPYWLIDGKLYDRSTTDYNLVTRVQKGVVLQLISPQRITNMISEEHLYGDKAYSVTEMLGDLKKGIFSELTTHTTISIYRRDLQKIYVEALITNIVKQSTGIDNDALSILKAHAKTLSAQMKAASAGANATTKAHLTDLCERINNALKPKDNA